MLPALSKLPTSCATQSELLPSICLPHASQASVVSQPPWDMQLVLRHVLPLAAMLAGRPGPLHAHQVTHPTLEMQRLARCALHPCALIATEIVIAGRSTGRRR